jgi:hypothetical protein
MVRNSSHLSVFVPQPLREALELSARANDRSLSAKLRCAIRSYVAAKHPSSDAGLIPSGSSSGGKQAA